MFSIKLFKKYCSSEWLPIFEVNKKQVTVKAKERIFNEGEKVGGIYFIEKGRVKILSKFNSSEEKIIGLASNGMILGHRGIHAKYYPVSTEALTDTVLTYLPIDVFVKILRANPDMAVYVLNFMSDELRDAEERMKYLQLLDPKKRVAIILIKLIESFGFLNKGSDLLAFTISRTDLANMAATTYETIIRTLSVFEKEKYIALIGKEIAIKNKTALMLIAKDKSSHRKKTVQL